MRRKILCKSIVGACTIALCLGSLMSGVSGTSISTRETGPWNFGTNWRFTWHIDVADSAFQEDTELRFFVDTLEPVVNGSDIESWDLRGSIYRLLDIGWMEMVSDALISRYTVGITHYEFFHNAFFYDILFLPMTFSDYMTWFRNAYTPLSSINWTISTNETTRTYTAINKTNANHVVNMTFSPRGALSKITRTYVNGTISFQMTLIEENYIGFDFESLYFVLGLTAIGGGIFFSMILINKLRTSRRRIVKDEMRIREQMERELQEDEADEYLGERGIIHTVDELDEDGEDDDGGDGA